MSNDAEAWYRKHYGPDANPEQVSYVDENGLARDVDLSKLTAMQRLQFANRQSFTARKAEPPLTDEERGMSPAEFEKLPAQRRLEIANKAYFTRPSTRARSA